MATLLSFNAIFPFKRHCCNKYRPKEASGALFFGQRSQFLRLRSPYASKSRAVQKDESLSSMISKIEREGEEQEEEFTIEEQLSSLADTWPKIHGRDNWIGMLDPMDPLLRAELMRYGEMAQACYDAFDYDPYSKYCGSCKFSRRQFFEALGMVHHGYEVTRYLYATSNINIPNFFKKSKWSEVWSKNANWIGYIAVSGDETMACLGRRDITIAWRGTVTQLEWIADLMDFLRPISSDGIPCSDQSVKAQSGFLDLYTDKDGTCRFCKYSAREQILTEIRRLVLLYSKTEKLSITVTGHSLGSALAMLSAYDIAETGLNVSVNGSTIPVCVFSYSGPRVGNGPFQERFEGLGVKALRVVNVHDLVPKVPGFIINEDSPDFLQEIAEALPWSYEHVGVELELDHKGSPFLKDTSDPTCFHNLEAHLHLLDGYHGKGKKYLPASGRDPALVNKACDFLKDHHLVPPHWRQDENKGMVKSPDGKWKKEERPRLEDHPCDMHHHLKEIGLHYEEGLSQDPPSN